MISSKFVHVTFLSFKSNDVLNPSHILLLVEWVTVLPSLFHSSWSGLKFSIRVCFTPRGVGYSSQSKSVSLLLLRVTVLSRVCFTPRGAGYSCQSESVSLLAQSESASLLMEWVTVLNPSLFHSSCCGSQFSIRVCFTPHGAGHSSYPGVDLLAIIHR